MVATFVAVTVVDIEVSVPPFHLNVGKQEKIFLLIMSYVLRILVATVLTRSLWCKKGHKYAVVNCSSRFICSNSSRAMLL